MRIRKNAKLSPLLFSSHASAAEDLQAHVCQLNQSPWDLIPFGEDHSNQMEGEDSFNGSFGDSIGAVESVASMMDIGEEKAVEMEEELVMEDIDIEKGSNELEDDLEEEEEGKRSSTICERHNGKGWHCKNRAKQGHSLCNHHLSLLRSRYSRRSSMSSKGRVLSTGAHRGRGTGKKGSSSNPYEFYYYSGFGPLWGRNRGDKDKEEAKMSEGRITDTNTSITSPTDQTTPHSSSSQISSKEFDFVHDDDGDDHHDDDDNHDGGSKGKRMRKPVKARSLKSLM